MKDCLTVFLVSTFASLALPLAVFGQGTIPEAIAGGADMQVSGVPSGSPPALESLLSRTSIIVRGTVGNPRSYLSDDQRDIYTDYQINNPGFAYRSDGVAFARPGQAPPFTVTLLGGRLEVSGVRFTQTEEGLPGLIPGTEVVLLLEEDAKGRYRPVGRIFGAFAVRDGRLTPLTKKTGFAPEVEGRQAVDVVAEMVNVAVSRRSPK